MSDSIEFLPLYVIYHDQWGFRDWARNSDGGWTPASKYSHRGHCHFFMLGFNPTTASSSRAYGGVQSYNFEIEDIWSTRSKDPNKTDNVRIIGQPKWFFEIEEYWRRVYVQLWDSPDNEDKPVAEKRGIKYEASSPHHTFGPFREIRNGLDNSEPRKSATNFFFFNNMSRALPLEYFKDEEKTMRDHFLMGGACIWNLDWDKKDINGNIYNTNGNTPYIIPKGFWCGGDITGVDKPSQEAPSRRYGYADNLYAYPLIEYQIVKQLLPTNERPPEWKTSPDSEGLAVSVDLPFSLNGEIQSPFSENNGRTAPIGSYCHGFEEKYPDRVLRYPEIDSVDSLSTEKVTTTEMNQTKSIELKDVVLTRVDWGDGMVEDITTSGVFQHTYFAVGTYTISKLVKDTDPKNNEWRIPEELKGEKVVWSVPDSIKDKMDGMWVEQCLGGIVKAKALVTIEDNFGGVKEIWITANNFIVDEKFSGMDQGGPN
jgi:hypothetical protein